MHKNYGGKGGPGERVIVGNVSKAAAHKRSGKASSGNAQRSMANNYGAREAVKPSTGSSMPSLNPYQPLPGPKKGT